MPAKNLLRRLTALPLVIVTVLLASTFVTTQSASAMSRTHRIAHAWNIARHQLGDPYRYGADGPNSFDCSGLVYYSFRKAGFRHIPRTSRAQAGHMRRIKKGQLRRGDLVFFYHGGATAGNVYHVGVFAGFHHGRRTIIDAPHSGARVRREPIWTSQWFAGTLRGM
jgi:cell wall-associated NlpC family hydrolase